MDTLCDADAVFGLDILLPPPVTRSTVDFPMAPWLIMKASQASNEALNKLTLIIYVKLLAIWTVEILISLGDEIRIRTHTHAHTHHHRTVNSDCDGIGQSDQS